ncbi:MAG: hypothetical protein IPK80_19255 [Nannocystis sp.]|nr:hypothetical protein [Nannocystis sp.]
MKTRFFVLGLFSGALVTGCSGDGGKLSASDGSTEVTGTSGTSGTSGTEGMSSTSGVMTTSGATETTTGSSTMDPTDTEPVCEDPSCECDLWKNNCPEGQKCMPWANDGGSSWNSTKCSPLDANPGKPGEPCKVEGNGVSGVDNCEAGAMCWGVNHETMEGYCIGFCDGSWEDFSCSEPNTQCHISGNGVLILCFPTCDPLLQNCEGGDLCLWGGESFICALDASGEEGQYGDPCEFANVCDPGLICINPEYVPGCQAGGCCTPWCDINEFTCPGEGQDCLPWFEDGVAPPGYENVGVCGVPQ